MNEKLLALTQAGFAVRRFHVVPIVHTPETVGHHTANVIAILFALYDGEPPMRLVKAALYHDIAEAITGDVPATAKWDFPVLKKALDEAEVEIGNAAGYHVPLDSHEQAVLKFADMLDLLIKSRNEVHGGNRCFGPLYKRAHAYCLSLIHDPLAGDMVAASYLLNRFPLEYRDE